MKDYLKKIFTTFKATLLTVLVVGILVLVFLYLGNYSEGYRAGVIVKISRKGYIFKTNEGEMNVGNYLTENTNLNSSIWKFSVENGQDTVIKGIENALLTGHRVKLYYKERYFSIFWRGDTKYFVYKAELAP